MEIKMAYAVTIKGPMSGWQTAHLDGEEIGGLGETSHEAPALRWYWRAGIFYGHCATRDEALAAIDATVPRILEIKTQAEAKQAEFAALPVHLQDLKAAMDAAEFERQRAFGQQPFNPANYGSACALAEEARTAFHVAHNQWLCRRQAA
jgi:hypothetical protein